MDEKSLRQIGGLQFAEVAKALGHAHRLVVLELLAQRERSVEDLATASRLSLANASQHLRLMRRAGLLTSRRDGKQILYRLSDPAVLDLVAALHRAGERNMVEGREIVGGYFRERDSMEPVTREELAATMEDGLVTVLDVRPEDEFEAGHLPHAINTPLRELAKQLRRLPMDRRSSRVSGHCVRSQTTNLGSGVRACRAPFGPFTGCHCEFHQLIVVAKPGRPL